ncbi:MAG TPA: glycine betaine ABC transporter substrate-binding protein [Candidatus Methylomirabilis sp.]|nr:glycine betaine ABC transporter substrate-binding protein [Candidatus Methylomirabilis sp.]
MRPLRAVSWVLALTLFFLASHVSAQKPPVTVGSKAFTEQLLVGHMLVLLLEDAGFKVNNKIGLGGTALVHQALVSGEVDTYIEYTGTGLVTILKEPLQEDPGKVYDTVQRLYKERFKATWLKPWGFNNTYALVLRKEDADRLRATKISDLIPSASTMVFGATQEFVVRPDGLPGLAKHYGGLAFKENKSMAPDLIYDALKNKQVDVISGFATEGRIPANNFVVLEDDKKYFPPYFAAPVVREDLLAKAPEVAEVLNRPAGKIDDGTMARLNFEVAGKKRSPEEVAREYLKAKGWIK